MRDNGFDEIYLATNYKSDYIENFIGNGERYGIKLKISKEVKPLGTVGPLTLLKDNLTEPFLVMNGDIVTLFNFKKFFEFAFTNKSMLTVAIKEMITPFQFGNITFEGDYITGIEEKPNIKTHILAGIYIFQPEIFQLIPDDEYYGMDTLMTKMLSLNIPISKFLIHEYWLDIGQVDDFHSAQEIYKTHFANSK